MPWEKTFEESDVIEKVMQVFWKNGYAATSIADLTEATGLKRGSLYNAFDGKRELFLKSLQKYGSKVQREVLQPLEDRDSPREAIVSFFEMCVKDSQCDCDRKGCLVVNTSLEYGLHDDEIQKVASSGLKALASFFEKQIKLGQAAGEIPQSIEPRPTSKALLAMVIGIRVMGRGAMGKTALAQAAHQAENLIS